MEKKKNSTKETEINASKNSIDRLDSLRLDNDDDNITQSPADDKEQFNAFMAEYRSLMSKSLPKEEKKEENFEEKEDVFKPIPGKKNTKKAENKTEEKKNENWDEAITLNPEKYTDPGEEDKIMVDSLPEDESEPDFDLGEVSRDSSDDFQLSINFSGEQQEETAPPEKKEYKYDPNKPRMIDWVFDFVEMFVFVLIAVMVLTSFFFKHSVVEGESMLNTLVEEDHLIISDLFYTPERGDIVVFEDYSTALKKAVVKRVIGLSGETVTVKINSAGAYEVYINGEYLDEPYAYNDIQSYATGTGEWIVGEGEVFVLGDNRFNSTDSRDHRVGTIDIDCILGKVLFRFMPFDKFGKVE